MKILVGASLLILAACEGPQDADKIADAQNCLDQATAEDVPVCVAKVDGIESEAAYLIRCAGKFIKEGFASPDKLANTLEGISGGETGVAGSMSMMAALAFQSEGSNALNAASADEALAFCTKANSKGMIQLSALAKTSTSLADLAEQIYGSTTDTTNMTGAELEQLMNDLKANPVASEVVGTAVAAIYTSSCADGGQAAGNYCQQFGAAVESVGGIQNTVDLGSAIMTCYTDPARPECAAFR